MRRRTPDDREQSRRFLQKAREIEADEDASAADDLLGKLAKSPPEPHKGKGALRRSDPDPMPKDDPEALIEWGRRNIQGGG